MVDGGAQATHLVEVEMPRLSDSMEEATILEWLKRPGDRIAKGEPLVEVETDKATIVYEAEVAGVLSEVVVDRGGIAALGEVIARIAVEMPVEPPASSTPQPEPFASVAAAPAAAASTPAASSTPQPEPFASVAAAPAAAASTPAPAPRVHRARATPVARRLAGELGVGLEQLSGTGPGGRIVRADVQASAGVHSAANAPDPVRGRVEEVALSSTQRTIAQRMAESRAQVPDFTVEAEIDMERAHRLREQWRANGHDPLPSFNDLVVKAVAVALREFPGLNAAYDDSRALRFSRVNVGIAVATEDALLVPTIFDADEKSITEVAAESRRLSEKVRSRSVTMDELGGGTFTVSNLGMFGVRRFNAVINRPQAAILAVGEVTLRPWVTPDGGLSPRRLMDVALSCDHRIVYGADGARFLRRLRQLLEDPTPLTDAD